MAVTAMGIKYANKVHDKILKLIEETGSFEGYDWRDDVHKRRQQDTYDSYIEQDYAPPIEPPEE